MYYRDKIFLMSIHHQFDCYLHTNLFFFQVLQVELSALKHNQARVHELSSYLMLSDPDEIARVTRSHQGSKATDLQARLDLMHRLQVIIFDCLNYMHVLQFHEKKTIYFFL